MTRPAWPVHPHGPLEPLADNLWQVTGSLPRGPLPRNMIVYRLRDGRLIIHSGIAMTEQGMAALESLGHPSVLIVPNGLHRLDAPFYLARYPGIEVTSPAAARAKVEQKVAVRRPAEQVLAELDIPLHVPAGTKAQELVYQLPLADGCALVCTDLLFNLPHQPGLGGMLLRLMGSTGKFGITRLGRLMFLRDRPAFADWLEQMAALPGLRILSMAHGHALTHDVPAALRRVAGELRG